MSRPRVSLITVNFNGRAHLDPFLQSVLAQEYPTDRLEVIIVDNGSSDGSVDLVRARYPTVKVLMNATNVGFAKASNQGAEAASGHYLALLNNDMRLESSWVSRMADCLDAAQSDVVCAGSLILDWEGSHVDFGGGTVAFNGIGFQTDARSPLTTDPHAWPDRMLFACGGALMVEREVYLEAGGFDQDYFAYLEDVDFGWRLWVLGFRVVFCPGAVAYHRHNATSSQFDSYRKAVLIERNAMYSVIKNYDDDSLSRVMAPSLLLAFKHMAVRSGIPREEFRFTPRRHRTTGAPPLFQSDESRLQAFLRVWRHEGSKVALSKSARKGRDLVGRTARTALRSSRQTTPVAHDDEERLIRRESYATVVAMEDVIDHLPQLLEKRRSIQAARRRADEEIFGVFGTPFKAPEQAPKYRGAYESAHETILRAFGVAEYFDSRTRGGSEKETAQEAVHDLHSLR